jgi:hypothetical protein
MCHLAVSGGVAEICTRMQPGFEKKPGFFRK